MSTNSEESDETTSVSETFTISCGRRYEQRFFPPRYSETAYCSSTWKLQAALDSVPTQTYSTISVSDQRSTIYGTDELSPLRAGDGDEAEAVEDEAREAYPGEKAAEEKLIHEKAHEKLIEGGAKKSSPDENDNADSKPVVRRGGAGKRDAAPEKVDEGPTGSFEKTFEKYGFSFGQKLGAGAFGVVRKADYVTKDGKVVPLAVKITDRSKLPPSYMKKFFPREVAVICELIHPYICRVHSVLQRKQFIFIFLEFAHNGDLLGYIQKNGVLSEKQGCFWCRQMYDALDYLQSKGYCHRDLKCENLLLSKHYNLKMADFGFTSYCYDRPLEDPEAGKPYALMSETYCGSASYCCPEVIRAVRYDPFAADIWSCGIILYVVCNGSLPFSSKDLIKMLKAQEAKDYKLRSGVRDKLSPQYVDLLEKSLEPDPSRRIKIKHIRTHEWLSDAFLKKLGG